MQIESLREQIKGLHFFSTPEKIALNLTTFFLYCRNAHSGPLGNMLNPYPTPTSSYFTTLPPLSPSTTTSTTSTAREGHEDEAEEYDYEENGSAFDSDLNADLNSYSGPNGSQNSGCQLTRSASEEALPVRIYSNNNNSIFFVLFFFIVRPHTLICKV